jgi:hypothetical protein
MLVLNLNFQGKLLQHLKKGVSIVIYNLDIRTNVLRSQVTEVNVL